MPRIVLRACSAAEAKPRLRPNPNHSAFYEDADSLGLGRNLYFNSIYGIDRFRIIGSDGQNRDGAVYGRVVDGVLYDRDWDNWSLGVEYALIDRSELLAA